MTADVRISVGLPAHPKTKKLIKRLGTDAAWRLVCLFSWVAANRPDGDLATLSSEDIELCVDWPGDDGIFVKALLDVGFLDGEDGSFSMHDWSDHNPWAAGADARSEKARWNGLIKNHGRAEAAARMPEYAARLAKKGVVADINQESVLHVAETSSATSMHVAETSSAPSLLFSVSSLLLSKSKESTPSQNPAEIAKPESSEPATADIPGPASPIPAADECRALVGEILPAEPAHAAKATAEQDACRVTWSAYADAYQQRYGVAPVRNAKVNAAIKSFTRRIGADESPGVARYFVSHADAFYGRKCHDVGLMLADAEKLRTEWATQRQVTGVTARQQERTGTMRNAVDRILAERGAA